MLGITMFNNHNRTATLIKAISEICRPSNTNRAMALLTTASIKLIIGKAVVNKKYNPTAANISKVRSPE